MPLSRRELLHWIALSAAGAGFVRATERVALALAEQPLAAPVWWVADGAIHQNYLALLGQEVPDLAEIVGTRWNLTVYDPWLPPPGRGLTDQLGAAPIVVIESLDPFLGNERADWAALLGQARAAVFLGTDACYGGLIWPSGQVAEVEAMCQEAETPYLKLPGVPVPPHHVVGTLGHLAFLGFPELDRYRRPVLYYGETLCTHCERRWALEAGEYAPAAGESGCLLEVGCKGFLTHNTCATHRWNGGVNWCVGAGAPCTGCSEPGYPDHAGLGLHGRGSADGLGSLSRGVAWVRGAGWAFFGAVGLGVALRLVNGLIDPERGRRPPRQTPRRQP